MNELHPGFSDDELHRWVDDRLDPVRAADVEAAMRLDPTLAATLRAWRAQRDALGALGRDRLDEVMPAAMRERIERAVHGAPLDQLAGSGSGGTGWPASRRWNESRSEVAKFSGMPLASTPGGTRALIPAPESPERRIRTSASR